MDWLLGTSLQQLELSLSRINHASNTNIILGGDFNLGHIDWSITAPGVRPPKIGKNMIFWRKIVIFHTKSPNNFSASLRNWKT
jgi:hypothetical protein